MLNGKTVLLSNLHDAAVPELDTRAAATSKPSSLRTSDRRSLLTYAGLPLNLFGKVRRIRLPRDKLC